MKTLRGYQIDDKKAIQDAWKEYRSVLYQLPTGGGKSVILASIIEDVKDKKVIVFAHKKKLVMQLKEHLNAKGIDCGILMGTYTENIDSDIIIASIRTAVKDSRLDMLIEKEWDYEIIDEARHSRTPSYDKVLEEIFHNHPKAKLLGVDATPYRKDKKRLDKHFQHLVVSQETTSTLMQKGFLQKCKTIVSPIELDKLSEEVKETTGDYQVQALSHYMRKPKFLEYVVSQYVTYGEGRQNIVFAVDIQHAKDLQQVFEDNGYAGKVARIDSTMSDSQIEKVFADFESLKIQILINVEMVTEGVDLPMAGCVTGARPTKSLTLYLQMAGRGARPDGENDYFILLDCCGWTNEYGAIHAPKTWSLNPEIDPNSGRQGYKVFRKDKVNGELIEVDDDFIGEVIEMSPEEYLQSLSGGRERAEQINVSIDDKIKALFDELIKLLNKLMKIDSEKFEVTYSYESMYEKEIKWRHLSGDGSRWSRNEVTMNIKKNNDPRVTLSSTDTSELAGYYETLRLAGGLGEEILKVIAIGKHKTIVELMDQAEVLRKSKIDLDQFRKAEEKLAADQRATEIEEHARLVGKFDLNKKLRWDDIFTKSYSSDKIFSIELKNGKINNHHNTLTLHVERDGRWDGDKREYEKVMRIEEKNYVKGERVLEMIELGKWNIEVDKKD